MILEHIMCLLHEESSAKCEIISKNVNKVVFLLPYKILQLLITVNVSFTKEGYRRKDGYSNWTMSNFVETIKIYTQRKKLEIK
jgi:hypothetical protein